MQNLKVVIDVAKGSQNDCIKCEVCNIELPNQMSFKQHVGGQRHVKLQNAIDEQRRVEQKCGIFIRGYPNYLEQDEILSHFAKFGKIVWTHFGHSFLLLDYSEPQAASKVLNRPQILRGRILTVKYRELNIQREVKPDDLPLSSLEHLKNIENLGIQVAALTNFLQGPTAAVHIPKYNQICNDLFKQLRSYPMCQIYPFGSSLTGLCFWSSDIDIYIFGIRRDNDDDIQHLFQLKKILNNSSYFKNVLVIGQAKIPILKCIHVPTNTNCDINIRNMLGVCNSKLILYYLSVDLKLKEMILIVKFWAKIHKITGQNHLFTNYSLCMMIIFYLQGNPYHLPSVRYLQEDPNYINIQEMWNGGFQPIRAFCPLIISSSLLELLANFFAYYAEFDYGSFVICPYLGVPVRKSDFKDPDNLPNCFYIYKRVANIEGNKPLKIDASICVQDPFEHTRNITPIISDSTLSIFVKFCKHAKQLTEQGEAGFLYKLFNELPPNTEIEKLTQNSFIQFGVQMGVQLNCLSSKVNVDVTDRSGAVKELWFDCVEKFTLTVLKDFLEMTVEKEGASSGKRQKMEGQTDVHTDLSLVLGSYTCAGKLNLWHSRKALNKSNNGETNTIIEREIELTKQMVKIYKDINTLQNIVEFKIVLEKKIEPAQVVFSLSKIDSYKKSFRHFGEFFASKFGSWFEMYIKEMNRRC